MLNTDNFTTFSPIFPFQILSEVREKSETFEGFFSGRNIFCKSYAGVTQSANIFEFSSLCLMAKIFAKMMSFCLGKLNNRGNKAVAAVFCENFCKLFKSKQKYKFERIRRTKRSFSYILEALLSFNRGGMI